MYVFLFVLYRLGPLYTIHPITVKLLWRALGTPRNVSKLLRTKSAEKNCIGTYITSYILCMIRFHDKFRNVIKL